jgi:hypothetical protein
MELSIVSKEILTLVRALVPLNTSRDTERLSRINQVLSRFTLA